MSTGHSALETRIPSGIWSLGILVSRGRLGRRQFFLSRTETWLLKSRLTACERRD